MVTEFLSHVKMSVDVASFDVAGPVINGRLKTTNLPWVMDETTLVEDLNLKAAHVMNALQTVARAVPALRAEDMITINQGEPVANGSIAIIAPGTGLGESFLTWDGSHYSAHCSERGHSDFAPTDERQIRLLHYLLPRFKGTWEWSVSALESVFGIFMNFFAMRKRLPNGRKLLSRSYPQRITRKRSWRLLSIRSIQANCAWRRLICSSQYWQARPAILH